MTQKIVYHRQFGQGIVTETRRAGLEYQVRFDDGSVRWIRVDHLESVDNTPASLRSTGEPRNRPSSFVRRQVVEALRLGIVPETGLNLFTIGRDQEIDALKDWLFQSSVSSQLVIGNYGYGKTHLLNYFRTLALEMGYAVSLVEMDPQESPFSKPKRVYSQIVRNLVWLDAGRRCDCRQLIQRGLAQGLLNDHHYFRHMLRLRPYSEAWEWLEGSSGAIRPTQLDARLAKDLPALYDYSTAANIYCNLLSGLGWLCRANGIGLKGLLILFDESEALYMTGGSIAVDRSVNFVDALIGTARGDEELLEHVWRTDLTYARHAYDVPFLYKVPSGLKLLFAFTGRDGLWISRELMMLPQIDLNPLHLDHYSVMTTKIVDVYKEAYPDHASSIDMEWFWELVERKRPGNTRAMMKTLIEALDISRFGALDEEDDW